MQKSVKSFILKHNLQANQHIRYIDLVSEIGELGKAIIECTNYGKKDFEHSPKLEDEMGDCLFSIFALCFEMNIDAEKALEQAMQKYETRFANKGNIGS